MKTPTISVLSRDNLFQKEVFASVGELFNVKLELTDNASVSDEGIVLLGYSRAEAMKRANPGQPCLAFVSEPSAVKTETTAITFSDTPYLSPLFRNVTLPDPSIVSCVDASPTAGDEVIARQGAHVLWLRAGHEGRVVDLVTVPLLASDNESKYLYTRLMPQVWFAFFSLVHFVGKIANRNLPPVRACFMVDDPNLHWPSYGYVKYREIAEDARTRNYHVSFATVPLDGWFLHPSAVAAFADNRRQLSLVVHGNDHTHLELAQKLPQSRRVALAAQALRRVERMERISGLEIDRFMAAPHGACSDSMAEALLVAGFDGACISRSSIMSRNPDVAWPAYAGLRPSEFFGRGLPVLPRFNMTSDPEVRLRLAAFFGEPLILMCHHTDLAEGLTWFRERAGSINTFPGAKWCTVREMAESNYLSRQDADHLYVTMYSKKVNVAIPSEVTQLCVERPWLAGTSEALRVDGVESQGAGAGEQRVRMSVRPNTTISIQSIYNDTEAYPAGPAVSTSLRAIVRRQLCELRDRLTPTADTLSRAMSKSPR